MMRMTGKQVCNYYNEFLGGNEVGLHSILQKRAILAELCERRK